MSQGFSCLCLWKEISGQGGYQETHTAQPEREGGESKVEKCEAEDI